MGRNCCCKPKANNCDPNNCPLCSCVEGVPEDIKFKDFKTVSYKLSGFRDIDYSHEFSGQGGNAVYTERPNFEVAWRHVLFNGYLQQKYSIKVKGFEVLNDKEFDFELVDAADSEPPGQCLYKPIKDCLIPCGAVEIEEIFSYEANGKSFAEITPIIYECEIFNSTDPRCTNIYDLTHRSFCWFMSDVSWQGRIGYAATYELYVQLQPHSAINSEWMTTKKPRCNDGLPENSEYPPCEEFEKCEQCDGSGVNDWPTGAIKIILVLKSVSPIVSGMENETGKYIKGFWSPGANQNSAFFTGEDLLIETTCNNLPACRTNASIGNCQVIENCDITYKYKYSENCKNPYVSNFNLGQSVGYCPIYGAYFDTLTKAFVSYGRIGLADEKVSFFTAFFKDEMNMDIDKGVVGYEFFNHQNFSFLKRLPFGPIESGKVCNIFSNLDSCIENIDPCPLSLDKMKLPSVTSFCIGFCPKEHICLTYDDATEELSDEYYAFGNPNGSCSFDDEKLNEEICVCKNIDGIDGTDKECEDRKLTTERVNVYGCASLDREDGPCDVSGISSDLTNNLLIYLFRSDRYNESGTSCDSEGNESTLLDPEAKPEDREYRFNAKDGMVGSPPNLIRYAIFGIEQQAPYSGLGGSQFHNIRGPKSSCAFDQFWYSGQCSINVCGERYVCNKCPCPILQPIDGGDVDCWACDTTPSPICYCSGEDTNLKKTIPVFAADWKVIPESIIPKPIGHVDRVFLVYNCAQDLSCLEGRAFVVPRPFNLKMKAKFK